MISINKNPFKLPGIATGQFYKIQQETNKRTTQIVYMRELTAGDLYLDIESCIRYSAECLHYPIQNSVGKIVGSLLCVNTKRLNFNPTHFYVRETSEFGTMDNRQTEGLGGIFVFSDQYLNIMVIPADPNVSDLMVLE